MSFCSIVLTLLSTQHSGLVTSIIRFTSFFTTDAVTDGTWASVNLMTWTVLEPGVYLIAACLPTYRPLLAYIRNREPLSTLHLGRNPHKHSATYGEHGTRAIPLAPKKGLVQEDWVSNVTMAGFERLEGGEMGARQVDE